eukprot:scaffold4022_cov122-Isochrysis_galbana.AAC.11
MRVRQEGGVTALAAELAFGSSLAVNHAHRHTTSALRAPASHSPLYLQIEPSRPAATTVAQHIQRTPCAWLRHTSSRERASEPSPACG